MISAAASTPSIEIRPAWPQDQAFVAATFREQLARGTNYREADRVVDSILDSERTRVVVAIDPSLPIGRQIIGWLAYVEMPRVRALLFAYVRKQNRGAGVARQLADTAWPRRTGQWVHAGLRGGTTERLLATHAAIEMPLNELI